MILYSTASWLCAYLAICSNTSVELASSSLLCARGHGGKQIAPQVGDPLE
jgi:hypothetical protein